MRKFATIMIVLLATSVSAFAGSAHNMDHMAGDHKPMGGSVAKHASMGHKMAGHGEMVKFGPISEGGFILNAHLKDVGAMMSKMGKTETHHFMAMFLDETSGEHIIPDAVAVRLVSESGVESEPVRLMSMKGHSGADIVNTNDVAYYEVGAKLNGKKVVFKVPAK